MGKTLLKTTMKKKSFKLAPELNLFQKRTHLTLGNKIYAGGQPPAELYNLIGIPNQIVKIVNCWEEELSEAMEVLNYLKKENNPAVVKIYQIGKFSLQKNGIKEYYYYYVMDRLKSNPRRVKGWLSYIEDAAEVKIKPDVKLHSKQMEEFINHTIQLKYHYYDTHEWNIMVNDKGDFKFVDLEAFSY
jgi:hypothetical protein